MPLGFPRAAVESALEFSAAPGDVIVASYPKSGTTWLQYIVWLLTRRQAIGPGETLAELFPHLEEVGADKVADQPGPRLIKTHLAVSRLSIADHARYIVIARNPFDCVVSFFHHTRGFPRHYDFAAGNFEDYFDCFVRGAVDFGDYFEHLSGWLAERGRDNLLFLTYEALRAEPLALVERIAIFLAAGGDKPGSLPEIGSVVAEAGFESMQRNQERWSSARPDWAPPFVRKGSVGDWRSLITPVMAARLLAKCDARLTEVSLEKLWPDIAAEARAYADEAAADYSTSGDNNEHG